MKTDNFDEIVFKYPINYNNHITKQKVPVAWDTETLNGSAFLLANSNGQCVTSNVTKLDIRDGIKTDTFMDMIYLMLDKEFSKTVNCFYNLEYDINALIKHLPENELTQFAEYNYCIYNNIYFGGIPRKSLDLAFTRELEEWEVLGDKEYRYLFKDGEEKIYKREKRVFQDFYGNEYLLGNKNYFFDLWQFFKYEKQSSLDAVAKKYLGDVKLDMDKLGYDKSNLPLDNKVIEYCIKDCTLTRDLQYIVINACNAVGIYFNKPYSCAALSTEYLYNYSEIRNPIYFLYNSGRYGINRKHEDILRFAYYAYKGGRSEVCKRGYFDEAYEYDVNSMYPYWMQQLYDAFKCDWFKLTGLYQIENLGYENIAYGFLKVNITINNAHVLPLPLKHKGYYVYGYGKFYNYYLTLEEYKMLDELCLIEEIELLDGYIGAKTTSNAYPYKKIVNGIYKERKQYPSDDFINPLFKIILNSSYGKLIEVNVNKTLESAINLEDIDSYYIDEYGTPISRLFIGGKYFNSIYASYITAPSRCMLYRGIMDNPDAFIASFTDSIISTEKMNNLKTGNELGDWEYNKGEITIIGSGVYQFVNDKVKTRTRGYHIKESINDNLGHEYIFDFEDFLMSGLNQTKVKKLKESIVQDDLGEFNQFITQYKKVNLNFDKKRIWFNPMIKTPCYSNIYKQYESKPFNINKLTGV